MERWGYDLEFEYLEAVVWTDGLKKYYGELVTKSGKEYKRSSLMCMRAGIQRHLSMPP